MKRRRIFSESCYHLALWLVVFGLVVLSQSSWFNQSRSSRSGTMVVHADPEWRAVSPVFLHIQSVLLILEQHPGATPPPDVLEYPRS